MHLQSIDSKFAEALQAGLFEAAFRHWSKRAPAIARFRSFDDLIALATNLEGSAGAERNLALDALCGLAREGDQEAGVLLLWVFSRAFHGIKKRIGDCPLSPEELESEMTAAFWEAVASNQGAERLGSRLFYHVLQAAWRAVKAARSEITGRVELEPEMVGASQKCADPSGIVQDACDRGALDEIGAELILATRVDGSPIGKVAFRLGLKPEAAGMRRKRAERALVAYINNEKREGQA